jgi:hypothetical protein
VRTQVEEFTEEKEKTKFEAFKEFEFSPKSGKKVRRSLGGVAIAVGSAGEIDLDHWFSCPGRNQKKHTE